MVKYKSINITINFFVTKMKVLTMSIFKMMNYFVNVWSLEHLLIRFYALKQSLQRNFASEFK